MDVAQLRYLLAVVDAGSLSRAASTLGVSQPALSQRMDRLERELGVRLLERGPRGVRPTPAGRDFYRDAHRLVRQLDHLARSAAGRHEVRGMVAVGLPSGAALHLAAPLFSWVRERYAGVRLELFESMSGYIDELFAQGRMDLCVVYTGAWSPARPGDRPVYAEQLHLAGTPPVRPRGDGVVTLAELAAVPVVAPGSRSSLRRLLEHDLAREGLELDVVADVESLHTMVQIARGGQACAILPSSAVAAGVGLDTWRTDPPLRRTAVLRTAEETSAPREAVDAVAQGIVAVTRELAGSDRWPGIDLEEHP